MSAVQHIWRQTRTNILSCALILFIGITVYGDHLKNPFQYDSVHYIMDNPQLMQPENVTTLEFFEKEYRSRALMTISIAWNALLGGLNPYGYHLLNLSLHLANGVLLFFIGLRACQYLSLHRLGLKASDCLALSLASALLFIIHPLQTEAVLDIMSRSEILSANFYLFAVLVFQHALRPSTAALTKYALAPVAILLAAVLGYSVKQTLITLPAVLLVYYLCGQEKNSFAIKILQKGKWILILIAGIALALLMQKLLTDERFLVGPAPVEKMVGRKAYMLSQPPVLVFYYLKLLLFPVNLNIDPDITLIHDIHAISFILASLLIAAAVYVAYTRTRSRIWIFCVIWFFCIISPSSSIITLQDLAAEHRVYLAAYGLILLAALLLWVPDKPETATQDSARAFKTVACILVIISMCAMTIKRCDLWRSELALWDDARKKSPEKARPLANIGRAYALAGDVSKAILFYEQSLAKNPKTFEIQYNLGDLYFKTGRIDEALQHIRLAALLEPTIPEIFGRLGEIYMETKQYEAADQHFRKALELNPKYVVALRNLGVVNYYYLKDKKAEARLYFAKALELNPDQADAHLIRRLLEQK